jgi:hypothetical protein
MSEELYQEFKMDQFMARQISQTILDVDIIDQDI